MLRGVTATHRILVPIFPVRIGAKQQPERGYIFQNEPGNVGKRERFNKYPSGVMVAALDSKSNPARGAGSIPALGTTDRADSRELKTMYYVKV